MEKVSIIFTIRNEEATLPALLDALLNQTYKPDEIIVTDAESSDSSLKILDSYVPKLAKKHISLRCDSAAGNRSVGRNIAIEKAKNPIIAVTDAGCIPHKDWLEKIASPLLQKKVDVVAGFYVPTGDTSFQKAMAAYTSTMPDVIDPTKYLPSSRSIAFTKSAWKQAGKYPESLNTSEDLQFARSLWSLPLKTTVVQDALVDWEQVSSYKEAAKAFYEYAKGDGKAGYVRPQVWLIYMRYILAFVLLYYGAHNLLSMLICLYMIWAIQKNYRYIRTLSAIWILPLLQIISDIAVMSGMSVGFIERMSSHSA